MAFKLEPLEIPTTKELAKFSLDPIDEEKKSILRRGIDLYDKTTNAIRTGVKDTVETLQQPGFPDPIEVGKAAIQGVKEGFTLDPLKQVTGHKILKGIPEFESDALVKLPFVENFAPTAAAKGISDAVAGESTPDEAKTSGFSLQSLPEKPGFELDRLENPEEESKVSKVFDTLRNFSPGDMAKGVFNTLKHIKNLSLEDPTAQVKNVLNLPKRSAEFSVDVVTDPLLPILEATGAGITRAAKIPLVAEGLGKVVQLAKSLPGARLFQRAGGAPGEFIKALDETESRIAVLNEKALEHAKYITENFTPAEDARIAQIAKGGITSDPKLQAAAEQTQKILGGLEKEAQDLGFLKDTYRTKLTNRQLADLRNEKTAIDARMEKLKGAFPHRERLLQMANEIAIDDTTLANELRKTAETYSLSGFKTRKAFQNVMEAVDESTKLPIRSKGRMLNLLTKAENVGGGLRHDVVKDIMDIADDAGESLRFKGLKPMINYIVKASADFPGKRKMLRDLETEGAAITKRIVQHYTDGGKGYLPRLYSIFESGQAKELAKKGVSLDDLLALREDQVSAINDLTPGEFDAFVERIAKRTPELGARIRKIGGERFMHRNDLTDEMRRALGEIRTASYPFVKGVMQEGRDVEFKKFFRLVSNHPEWAQSIDDFKVNAARLGGEWRKMPDSKNIGDLAGKMVRKDVADEILYVTRTIGPLQKNWQKLMSSWKVGKVILNPSTHFRNMISNSVLLDLSGVDLLTQTRLIPKAAREMLGKGQYLDEFKQSGLLRTGFIDNEIRKFLPAFEQTPGDLISKTTNAAKAVAEKVGNIYQSEEMLFKMVKFIAEREKGVGIAEAAGEAEKWLFNYDKLAPATRTIRQMPLGSPFITFTAKALPRIAEAAAKNPARLYKYKAIFNAIEDRAKEALNLSDQDVRSIKRTFRGTGLILPVKDQEGLPMVMDLSYILPWGDIGETGGFFGLPNVLPPGGPLLSVFEAGFNKSLFTEKEIRNKTESWHIQAADTADFIAKALTPSLTPGVNMRASPMRGGYSFNKIMAAIKKTPDYRGRVRTLAWTLADTVFGLKAFPVDANEKAMFEAIETKKDVETRVLNAKRVLRHPGVSEEEKTREYMRLRSDLERILTPHE